LLTVLGASVRAESILSGSTREIFFFASASFRSSITAYVTLSIGSSPIAGSK
jgi:hypothetical protein